MKKTLKQLKDERQAALSVMQNLIENAESEDRNLNLDEQATFDENEKTADRSEEHTSELQSH